MALAGRGKTSRSRSEDTYHKLRSEIASGQYIEGERLLSEPLLAAKLEVSRVTLRRVLDRLMAEGIVERRPGAGTFLREREFNGPVTADMASFLANISDFSTRVETEVRDLSAVGPPAQVQAALRLGRNETVEAFLRLYSRYGVTIGIEKIYLPTRIMMRPVEKFDVAGAIPSALINLGIVIDRASQRFGAEGATAELAEAMKVPVGLPLISVTRVFYDTLSRGVLFKQGAFRPDVLNFQFDVLRAGFSLRRAKGSQEGMADLEATGGSAQPREQRN
ncbi:PhnF Transcriptional regulators [Rhabdaerophilaceae bacterium]